MQYFAYIPLVMVIVFFVSIPLFYLMQGIDEQIDNKDYDDIIKLIIAIVLLIICFISYIKDI